MSGWVLVPSLVELRTEYNAIAPFRRRGADGSIGDSNHSSSSDHTPDEDSDVLRDHDADSKNEVHALDIDSAGPWPGGAAWFDASVKAIVERHRTGQDNRLKYVIWNRQIASASNGWRWVTYTGSSDPHTNHAHFSSRYTTAQENDTSPWGLIGAPDMQLSDLVKLTASSKKELGGDYAKAGTVSVETAFNLLLIYAVRGAEAAAAGAVDSSLAATASRDILARINDPASPVDQTVAVLRALLGARAKAVGQALAEEGGDE